MVENTIRYYLSPNSTSLKQKKINFATLLSLVIKYRKNINMF